MRRHHLFALTRCLWGNLYCLHGQFGLSLVAKVFGFINQKGRSHPGWRALSLQVFHLMQLNFPCLSCPRPRSGKFRPEIVVNDRLRNQQKQWEVARERASSTNSVGLRPAEKENADDDIRPRLSLKLGTWGLLLWSIKVNTPNYKTLKRWGHQERLLNKYGSGADICFSECRPCCYILKRTAPLPLWDHCAPRNWKFPWKQAEALCQTGGNSSPRKTVTWCWRLVSGLGTL